MQLGWRGWWKTVAVTAAVTSAFWVIVGGWFWHRHLGEVPAAPTSAPVGVVDTTAPQTALVIPVVGVRPDQLSDTFTQGRAAGARQHDAIDIMAPEGTAVAAAAPGTVEKLFLSQDGGNTVYVRSPDRATIYYYAHLSAYAPGLAEGEPLKQGDPIGTVGHTGNADAAAPHLHFAIWRTAPERKWSDQAEAINPYPLLARK